MDIEKAKKELLSNVTLAGGYEPPLSKAIQTVLNELDKKDKIIDILLNEAAKEGTPTEFEYRKNKILEIVTKKVTKEENK